MSEITNQNAVHAIARVTAAIDKIVAYDLARKDAQNVVREASAAATAGREQLLVAVATIAHGEGWSQSDIFTAVETVKAKRNNKKDTSVNTFLSEIKSACNPLVRPHVKTLYDAINQAWESEKDADDKPLRKAFQRRYHCLIRSFGEAEEGRVLTTTDKLTSWACANDPSHNAKKVYVRFDRIREMLREFYRDFPIADLHDAVEYLDTIKKTDFAAARKTEVPKTEVPKTEVPKIPETYKEAEQAPEPSLDERINAALDSLTLATAA